MKTLDYINIREAHVHGIVNPTFIMRGNCDLQKYSLEIVVDGKERKAKFLPDLVSDNYELSLSLNKSDSKIKVYLLHDNQKELICVRKNNLLKRIKSKIRTFFQNILTNILHGDILKTVDVSTPLKRVLTDIKKESTSVRKE